MYVIGLNGFLQKSVVVAQSIESNTGLFEGFLSLRELIAEDGNHTNHFTSGIPDGLNYLQRASSRRDKVLYDNNLLSYTQVAFNKILDRKSVV